VELPSTRYEKIESEPGTEFDGAAREMFSNSGGHERAILTVALFLAAFLFMLLPTVNLVNINISRIIERASEIGVRKSFGASSATLVGQFLVENILLTFIGGVIGFILSIVILSMLGDSGLFQYSDFHLNVRLFFYALGSILCFGVISGVYPAWKMARMHPVNALKGAMR
jgi:putative ABC transport system permease protein